MSKGKNKKKIAIIIVVVIVLAAAVTGFLWKKGILFQTSADNKVYVESVSTITGIPLGTTNQFMGVVEAGQTEEFKTEGDREISEVFVKVGDTVTAGTALFSYDNKEDMREVERLQQEIAGYDSQIARYQNQIAELEAERNTVPDGDKFEYTTEIQTIQLSIDEAVNSKQAAQQQIQETNQDMEKNVVKCTIDGVVKSISDGDSTDYDSSQSFMTILSESSLRVKATVNEQNIAALSEGQEMLLRSRVNDATWKGVISKVDTDNPVTGGNADVMESEGDGVQNTSTKYNVYINIEDAKGLMLGQHLYVELDNGQNGKEKGIWLNRGYVVEDGDEAYIWCANDRDKLEKRKVKVGKYNEETDEILVKKGINGKDYIAFPSEALREGMAVMKAETVDENSGDESTEDISEDIPKDESVDEAMESEGAE